MEVAGATVAVGGGPLLGGHKGPSWPKEPRLGEGGDRFGWVGAARGPQVSILSGVRMCHVRYSRPVFTVPRPCGPYHETAPHFPALSFLEGRTFQREDLQKLGSPDPAELGDNLLHPDSAVSV